MTDPMEMIVRSLETEAAPDYPGVLIGWRAWRVSQSGTLYSIHQFSRWMPQQEKQAHCVYLLCNPSPGRRCSCGIYVAHDNHLDNVPVGYDYVYGRCALWGQVIQGTRAHRGEFAYPVELFAHPRHHKSLQRYGVPVHTLSKLPKKVKKNLSWLHRYFGFLVFVGGCIQMLTVNIMQLAVGVPHSWLVASSAIFFLAFLFSRIW